MSSSIVSKDSKLYSTDEVTPILNTADFWMDMSDSNYFTLSSTTRVNTITDKSYNAKTITRSGTITYDTIRKGIQPLGTSGTDYLTVNIPTPLGTAAAETIFIVAYVSNTNNGALLGGTATGTRIMRVSASGVSYGKAGASLTTGSTAITSNRMFVVACVLSNGSVTIYHNAKFDAVGAISLGQFTVQDTTNTILRANGTSFPMRGCIYEVLMYQRALTYTQIQAVNYYLMNKWGIPMTNIISSPLSITQAPCALWLDGDDASTVLFASGSTTLVTQWSDKSGNNYHATQTNTARMPTYIPATAKGLKFIGLSGTISTGLLTNCPFSTTETIFAVVNLSTVAGDIIGTTNASRGRQIRPTSSTSLIVSDGLTLVTLKNNSLGTTDKILFDYVNDASSNYFEMTTNSLQDSDSATALAYSAGTYTNVVGATTSNTTVAYDSYIYELIVFNAALSTSNRLAVEKYLTNKWGIRQTPVTTYPYPYYNSRPATRVFTPLDINDCAAWFDASDLTTVSPNTNGSTLISWTDKSSNAYVTTTFVNAPTYSNNAIRFNGSQGLGTTLTASSNVESAFFVCGTTDMTKVNTLIGANPTGGRQFRMTGGDLQTLRQDVAGVVFGGPATIPANTTVLVGYVNDGTTLTHYYNGTLHKSGSASAYTAGVATTIGLRAGAAEGLYGYINEMVIYNRALQQEERQIIESYLAQKWGLINSLPGHLGRTGNYLSIDPRTVASNCALWLDASDPLNNGTLPTNASSLTTWYDKSTNGRNAISSGSPPTFYTAGLNSKPSVYFNSNSLLSSGWNLAPSRQFAWFVVVNVTSVATTTYQRFLIANGGGGSGYNFGFFGTYSNTYKLLGIAGSTTFSAPVSTKTANPGIGTYVFGTSEVGSNVGGVGANGEILVQLSGNTGAIGSNGLEIGFETGNTSSAYLIGYISEIICYNGNVTQVQRQTIEAYLAQKWDLVSYLPSNHPTRMYKALATPWNPSMAPTLSMWLSGDDNKSITYSSGSNVSGLLDKQANYTLAQTYTSGFEVTTSNTLNGLDTLYFPNDPVDNNDTRTYFSTSASFTINATIHYFFYVFRFNPYVLTGTSTPRSWGAVMPFNIPAVNGPQIGLSRVGGSNWTMTYSVSGVGPQAYGAVVSSNAAGPTTGTPMLLMVAKTSTTAYIFGYNGTITNTTGAAYSAVAGTARIAPYFQNQELCEMLVYQGTVLSTYQRQQIEGYLAHRWGLTGTLPSTHPFRKIRP